MNRIIINSYQDLLNKLGSTPNSATYFYRGTTKLFECIPSLWYKKCENDIAQRSYEAFLIEEFLKLFETQYSNYGKNPIYAWGLARHAGLPSRMMDFSFNLSVSLQFGFEMSKGEDVLIYAIKKEGLKLLNYDKIKCGEMLDSKESIFIQPCILHHKLLTTDTSKLSIQGAKFFWQPFAQSKRPIEYNPAISQNLTIFEIPFSMKLKFYNEIQKENIDMYKSVYNLHGEEAWRPSPALERLVKIVTKNANDKYLK